jgi:uncharacterized protein
MSDLPRPVDREDPLFAPYWEGTDAGEIRVQRCPSCGRHRWPPRPMCRDCHTAGTEWVAVAGHGVLFSWIDVRHPTVRGVPPPYTVGLVELPAVGVRMLGQVVDSDPREMDIGMPLIPRFDASPSGVTLVNWAPADGGRGGGRAADGGTDGGDG